MNLDQSAVFVTGANTTDRVPSGIRRGSQLNLAFNIRPAVDKLNQSQRREPPLLRLKPLI